MSHENIEPDHIDMGIIYQLQEDARNYTTDDIAEAVDVSSSTVSNRIKRLEEAGIFRGYGPHIDYKKAGIPLHILFICTVSPDERDDITDEVIDVQGVVNVRVILTDTENVHVEVVSENIDDIVGITESLRDADLKIESSELLEDTRFEPFDHYGESAVEE